MVNRIDLRFVKKEQVIRPFFEGGKLVGFSFRRSGSSYYNKKWFNEDAWNYLVSKITGEKGNE